MYVYINIQQQHRRQETTTSIGIHNRRVGTLRLRPTCVLVLFIHHSFLQQQQQQQQQHSTYVPGNLSVRDFLGPARGERPAISVPSSTFSRLWAPFSSDMGERACPGNFDSYGGCFQRPQSSTRCTRGQGMALLVVVEARSTQWRVRCTGKQQWLRHTPDFQSLGQRRTSSTFEAKSLHACVLMWRS